MFYRVVRGAGLALTGRQEDALDASIRGRSQDVVGAVRRAVGDEDYLEAVAWIVEPADVGELIPEPSLLVVGRDDEGDCWELRRVLDRRSAVSPRAQVMPIPAHLNERVGEEEHYRVEEVGVRHQEKRCPEDELCKAHGEVAYCAPRPKSTIFTVSTRMRTSSQKDMCLM